MSACVDPANFDKELGEKYALEDVVSKIWKLEGYLLAHDIYRKQLKTEGAPLERMIYEDLDLVEKLEKLKELLSKPKPEFISDKQWLLLKEQKRYMNAYHDVLNKRIENLTPTD